jgi:hypothetical protein
MQVPAMQTSLRKENSTSNSTIEFPSVSRLGGSPNFAARSNRTRESKTQATHDSSAALNAKFATELAAIFGELRLAAPARGAPVCLQPKIAHSCIGCENRTLLTAGIRFGIDIRG